MEIVSYNINYERLPLEFVERRMENTQMYTLKEKLTRLYFNKVFVMADDVQREGEGKKRVRKD